jgi:hypothetical protein
MIRVMCSYRSCNLVNEQNVANRESNWRIIIDLIIYEFDLS